jgi:hypothetical protein
VIDEITLAYVVKGFCGGPHFRPALGVLSKANGEIDAMQVVINFAQVVDEQYYGSDFGGVFAFDVAEPMGLWIAQWTAKHKQPPSEEQVAEKTRELIEGVAA